MMRHRPRRPIPARRPTIAPKPQLRPHVDPNLFDWVPGERVDGPTTKLGVSTMARLRALYGRSKPEGGAE
jgi:hypothetical protein